MCSPVNSFLELALSVSEYLEGSVMNINAKVDIGFNIPLSKQLEKPKNNNTDSQGSSRSTKKGHLSMSFLYAVLRRKPALFFSFLTPVVLIFGHLIMYT